jgi:hypothetical protein
MLTERYEEAIAALKRAISADSNYLDPHLLLAANYSELEGEVTVAPSRKRGEVVSMKAFAGKRAKR